MRGEFTSGGLRAMASGLLFSGSAVAAVAMTAFFGPAVESRHLPVLKDIRIERVVAQGSRFEFGLFATKSRVCRLVDITAITKLYGQWSVASVETKPPPEDIVVVGSHLFGRWSVYPIGQAVRVAAVHRCHPLWDTVTFIGEWSTQEVAR